MSSNYYNQGPPSGAYPPYSTPGQPPTMANQGGYGPPGARPNMPPPGPGGQGYGPGANAYNAPAPPNQMQYSGMGTKGSFPPPRTPSVPVQNGPSGGYGGGPDDQMRNMPPNYGPPPGASNQAPMPPRATNGFRGEPMQNMGPSSSENFNQLSSQMAGMNMSGPGSQQMQPEPPRATANYGQHTPAKMPPPLHSSSPYPPSSKQPGGPSPPGTGAAQFPPTQLPPVAAHSQPSFPGSGPPQLRPGGPPTHTPLPPGANTSQQFPPSGQGQPLAGQGQASHMQMPPMPTSNAFPGAPPPSAGAPPPPGTGFPPSSTGFPPPSSGFPPTSGSFPPTSTGFPPTSGSFPPPNTGFPPTRGSFPPPGTQQPPQQYGAQANMNMPPSGPSMQQGQFPPPAQPMAPGQIQGFPPNAGPGIPPGVPPGQQQMHQTTPPASPGSYPPARPGFAPPAQPHMQAPRRLDPDQMPSPIQVIELDKENARKTYNGIFQVNTAGLIPPLVTSDTEYISEDLGFSTPSFIRSSMYTIPMTADMLKTCHVPFVLNIAPFAQLKEGENPIPVVDMGSIGPIRCNRCKAYMSPFMQFIEGGRRFKCPFCGCNTEVPAEYFQHLDQSGRRVDWMERPELCLGTYEMLATLDYCKEGKPSSPPAFIFMIDVSYNSVRSGLVHLICAHLKEVLYELPKETGAPESEVRVGFVTYAKDLHFYNVKGSLSQPQMLVVSDVDDVFVPLIDGFLVKLSEAETVIDSLLAQIPEMFANSQEVETVLGPVIQAGLDALQSSGRAGKLFIFHSSLPLAEAPGKLKGRDDSKLLGTDKEKTILTPQTTFYTKLGQQCVEGGCSVDLFLFPNSYVDVATISEVSRLTGGSLYYYKYFQADIDGQRFIDDLKRDVAKPIAFDSIMRVRTSTGVRPVDFLGNFYMSNTTDVELAALDCDKSIVVEVKHDDKLSPDSWVYVQTALLYTSVTGQRKLRIINAAFTCCSEYSDLFRNCELDVVINYFAKLSIRESLNSNPKQVRDHLTTECAHILACYRQKCATSSSQGQLILPECMKLLPVYVNCITKAAILQGHGEISTDDRSVRMFQCNSMSVNASQAFFYPRLLPLHNLDVSSNTLPVAIRASYERLQDNGVYVLENGCFMFIWIGHNVDPTWVQDVFGVQSAAQIDIDKTRLQDFDNPSSRRVREVLQQIRTERDYSLKLVIIRQRDKLEPVFSQFLVEDRSTSGTPSYVDYLCHIHKEIRSILS